MNKVFSKGMSIQKKFIEKFGEENTLIVSADIENQINELESSERKNVERCIWLVQ